MEGDEQGGDGNGDGDEGEEEEQTEERHCGRRNESV